MTKPEYSWDDFIELVFTPKFSFISKSELMIELFNVYSSAHSNKTPYQIGRDLGISERQVQSYMHKRSLLHNEELDCSELLITCQKQYDATRQRIILQLNNIFERETLENVLIEKDLVVLGTTSKYIELSPKDFLEALSVICSEEAVEEYTRAALKEQKEINRVVKNLGGDSLAKLLLKPSKKDEFFNAVASNIGPFVGILTTLH